MKNRIIEVERMLKRKEKEKKKRIIVIRGVKLKERSRRETVEKK